MCIDFLVKFRTVHRFFGEVLNMCVDFLVKFPTCATIFCGSFPLARCYFWGDPSMRTIIFLAKFPTCPSILLGNSQHVHRFLADVPNMCMDFLVEFPTCACFFGGKFGSQMSIGILGTLIPWVISHMTNRFLVVEESIKCITCSLGTCLSSINFHERYLTRASVLRASQVASIGCNYL